MGEYIDATSLEVIVKRRQTQHAITDEEQWARYAFVLGNVPASVADKAFAAGFARLPLAHREVIVDQLRSQLPDVPSNTAEVPEVFARLMRDLRARAALVGIGAATALAAEFVASAPIAAYFARGVGSVSIEHQPLWVQELAGHEVAPIDGGRAHHRPGVNSGEWFGT
ncbi:hypothetical protein [Microbacterium kyungheense]|uniref:Uncharacterized protein n=1 Tax=Microbacterium kyungheense TaxID=1263636 RepID=A0A543FK34_9MICO|nr:hypothetical protein [Microbacterium kyungheense]TQM34239.1 hypothetical protein FB391_0526 [Microbacterium kyungheense]